MARMLWATTLCCGSLGMVNALFHARRSDLVVALASLFTVTFGTVGAAAGVLTDGKRGAVIGFAIGSLPGLLFLGMMFLWAVSSATILVLS